MGGQLNKKSQNILEKCNAKLLFYFFTQNFCLETINQGNSCFRLVGCQDLLEDIPWRSGGRRESLTLGSPDSGKSFIKGPKRSGSKTYTLKEDISSKIKLLFLRFLDYINKV